jgi:hypothetical protein
MDISQEHHELHGQARHSHLARFTGRFRDTLKRSGTPSQSHHVRAPSQIDMTNEQNMSIAARRSSSYTDRAMRMFTSSARLSSTGLNINDLPTEILQNIFLDLDIFVLLRIRRVCKLWYSLIPGDSPLLAEDLFLKPSHNLHAYSFTTSTMDLDFEINPRNTPADGNHPNSSLAFIDGLSMTRRCLGVIRTSEEIIFHPIILNFNYYVQGDQFGRPKLTLIQEKSAEPVKWRNMLVSMPPLTELRISQTWGGRAKLTSVLRAKDGIKLGDLIDTLLGWGAKEVDKSG